MKYILIFFSIFFFSTTLLAQSSIVWTWAKPFTSDAMTGEVLGVTGDSEGNSFLCGGFSGTTNFEVSSVIAVGMEDGFVMKVNSSGSVQWIATCSGGITTLVKDIVLDNSGNIYVVGRVFGNTNFGTLNLNAPSNVYHAFIAKLNTSGQWEWVKDGFSDDGEEAISICRNSNGNFFVLGNKMSNGNLFVAKLNLNGDQVWKAETTGASTYSNKTRKIILDHDGNAIFLAQFMGTINCSTFTVSQTGSYNDMMVAKINDAGSWQWAEDLDSMTSFVDAWGLAVDIANNIYVSGDYSGSVTMGTNTLTTTQTWDMMVFKLNSSGDCIAAFDNSTSTVGVQPKHIISDSYDHFYIYGLCAMNGSTLGTFTIPLGMFIGKMSTDGVWDEVKVQQNTTTAEAIAFGTDGEGHCILGGNYSGMPAFGSTVFALPGGYSDIFAAKTGNIGPLGINDPVLVNVNNFIQVWPNPSTDLVNIKYNADLISKPTISVYNLRGEQVRLLRVSKQEINNFSSLWDGKDKYGHSVTTRIYLIQIRTSTGVLTKKVMMLR
jgi:hypothetical protein